MRVTDDLYIDEKEFEESFIRASGPGGQNINKVSTAVQLRFHVLRSLSLPIAVRERLCAIARNRMTKEGILIIEARNYRTQDQNRQDARRRLAQLILMATKVPPKRLKTDVPYGSTLERLRAKKYKAKIKSLRKVNVEDGDE